MDVFQNAGEGSCMIATGLLRKRNVAAFSLMALAVLISIQNLTYYLSFNFNLFMALLVFPFIIRVHRQQFSMRYAWLSLAFFSLYPFLKIQLCFFFGFAFFLMFVAESFIGKLNSLPVFLLTVISPVSIYILEMIGFPLRLKITEWAVALLQGVYPDVTQQGNAILLSGQLFSVDRECAGLRMTITSFLICIAWIAYREKRTGKGISFMLTGALMLITAVLIIICNLFRIITLVVFNSAPETFSHEAIGLMSLGFCVFLPLALVTWLTFHFFGKEARRIDQPSILNAKIQWVFILCLLPFMAYLNINRENYRNTREDMAIREVTIPGYAREVLGNGVVKFTNASSLVYIKPSLAFYAADHSPLMCWNGSGYEFTNENIIQTDGYKLYFAELKSDKDKLFTAWWYYNGTHKTTNQLDWRWRMLNGEAPFRVVNVTCTTYDELVETATCLMERDLFNRDSFAGNK